MDARASSRERGGLETAGLAGLGALALAAERVDELADEVATRLGIDREEVEHALTDALAGWRREARGLRDSSSDTAARVVRELGVASADAVEELELRVAQLEHRLSLVERG